MNVCVRAPVYTCMHACLFVCVCLLTCICVCMTEKERERWRGSEGSCFRYKEMYDGVIYDGY